MCDVVAVAMAGWAVERTCTMVVFAEHEKCVLSCVLLVVWIVGVFAITMPVALLLAATVMCGTCTALVVATRCWRGTLQ